MLGAKGAGRVKPMVEERVWGVARLTRVEGPYCRRRGAADRVRQWKKACSGDAVLYSNI